MRVHAGQLSLLEIDEPPKGDASKRQTERKRQAATRHDKPAAIAGARRNSTSPKRVASALVAGDEPLLTTVEVATLLRVHPRTVQRLVARGELRAVRLGNAVRFDPHDVGGMIEDIKGGRAAPDAGRSAA